MMVESEKVESPRKGKKSRKCGHLKMQVIPDLKAETFKTAVKKSVDAESTVVMDNLSAHSGVEEVTAKSEIQTVPGKDTPKVLPWVHIAISNAKSLFKDMYHGAFLQEYLNEFCYKFNRMYFGDRLFDRLMLASISYRPTFTYRRYRSGDECG